MVQQKVEDALSICIRYSCEELKLIGAGRTSADIYALDKVKLQNL